MVKCVWLVVLLLLLLVPITIAEDFDFDVNITVDWIGNNEFYIRTEDYDTKFSCNNSQQNDTTLRIELERDIDLSRFNTSIDVQNIIKSLDNMSHQCDEVIAEYNFSQKYANTKATLGRIDAEHDECKKERDTLVSYKANLTNDYERCQTTKNELELAINGPQGYRNMLRNATKCCNEIKTKSDENVTYFIFGAGAMGVIWFLVTQQKKKHEAPEEIRKMGYR